MDDEKSPEPDPELARRIDQLCARLWLRPSVRVVPPKRACLRCGSEWSRRG